MVKHKGQNQGDELEKYLDTALNLEIYQRLDEGDQAGLFEPLEFFSQLYSFYSYAKPNKSRLFALAERLNETDFTDEQKSFLLYYLDRLLFEKEVLICLPKLESENPFETRWEGLSLIGGVIQRGVD